MLYILHKIHRCLTKQHNIPEEIIPVAPNPLEVQAFWASWLSEHWCYIHPICCFCYPMPEWNTDLGRTPSNCPLIEPTFIFSVFCQWHLYTKTTFEAFVNIRTADTSNAELLAVELFHQRCFVWKTGSRSDNQREVRWSRSAKLELDKNIARIAKLPKICKEMFY